MRPPPSGKHACGRSRCRGDPLDVLCHRGYWKGPEEKNTEAAFRRGFALGLGTETDLRDDGRGGIVISHDPVRDGSTMTFEAFLALHGEYGHPGRLALNIKADGLARSVRATLDRFPGVKAFVFDMSVPDAREYPRSGLPLFSRLSEQEPFLSWAGSAAGVWLDGFDGVWYGEPVIGEHLAAGRSVCLVSPELHRRPPEELWSWLAASRLTGHSELMLCTDLPEEALARFCR